LTLLLSDKMGEGAVTQPAAPRELGELRERIRAGLVASLDKAPA